MFFTSTTIACTMYIDANVEEEKIIVPSLNKCQFMSSLSQFGILFRKIQRISNDRDKKSLTNLLELSCPDQWCSGGGDACKNRWKWSLAHTLKGEINLSNGNVETFSIWLSIIIQWFLLLLIFDFWAVIYNRNPQ